MYSSNEETKIKIMKNQEERIKYLEHLLDLTELNKCKRIKIYLNSI